ncbi:MAG: PIN domain-containing protein [Verrucomicrobia subdivision 3 bacterium]|nr:PIN domain-containing protein [Limisphaerales bacterium]
MNFADTNWLTSVYIEPHPGDAPAVKRRQIVEQFMRRHGGQLAISHVVLLEARNLFSRITGEREPREWQMLEADFDGRLYVDPMNWDLLRRECHALFSRYAWKAEMGTFDTAIVASAKLAGATRFLSFDATARVIAAAQGIEVFPMLDAAGKRMAWRLKP